jgi:predicted DCC family thiol-disulfide oxidoreductase YuxK
MKTPDNILFFDAQCLMCNKFIQFVFNRDKLKVLYYSDLNSEVARNHCINTELNSFVLFHEGEYFVRSKAFINVLKVIRYSPLVLTLLKLAPSSILDSFYKLIANNRLLFGNTNNCLIDIKHYQLT